MASSSNPLSPPHFNGENYHVWAVKMRAYLRGLGVWQYVEENRVPPSLRQNPTLNQIRQHEDEVAKAPKALSYIHAAVSDSVFTRIMACESAHEAWMKLKTEFQGLDIMFATSILSRFMNSPSEIHLVAAKRVLRYIRGTVDYGLFYKRSTKVKLLGFFDSDWAGSVEDMKATTGYCFTLGSGVICWGTKKQTSVAQSTAEAKYCSSTVVNQAIWLRKILVDLGFQQNHPTEIL
ncbi:hypothetical protein GH714_025906 [Hevea brasiliensis]|uniref:Uncharacterized protein n=1 Tax=Hevea brasiliensis TaxID=3981 RepID=A0A6A6N441_HEVBR|nr:hypothetical protein GH714_025906 [Hevea brasiliensis]